MKLNHHVHSVASLLTTHKKLTQQCCSIKRFESVGCHLAVFVATEPGKPKHDLFLTLPKCLLCFSVHKIES